MSGKVTKLPSGPWLVAVVSVVAPQPGRAGASPAPFYCFVQAVDLAEYGDLGMMTLTEFIGEMLPDFVAAAQAKHKFNVTVRAMTRRQLNRLSWQPVEETDDGDGA